MIEMGKKYKTRDGRDVRIYAVDANKEFPIHGAIFDGDNGWQEEAWTADGSYFGSKKASDCDLIEVKPERWRAIYKLIDGLQIYLSPVVYPSRDLAMLSQAGAIDAWKEPE